MATAEENRGELCASSISGLGSGAAQSRQSVQYATAHSPAQGDPRIANRVSYTATRSLATLRTRSSSFGCATGTLTGQGSRTLMSASAAPNSARFLKKLI